MGKKHSLIKISIFGILLGSVVSVRAQGTTPTATATPTPTIVALEQKITALETETSLLNERKDVDKQSLQNDVQNALIPIVIWAAILSALGVSAAVGTFAWVRNFSEKTKKQVEEETHQKLDQAFYNADPLYYPLYVPKIGFEIETKRLRKLGFKDLREYNGLRPAILNGIVIVRVPGENFKDDHQDKADAESALKTLEDFMIENKAADKNAAFVLYITGGMLAKANNLTAKYDNIVIANMPVTIAEHVYALVRGLTALEPKEDK